MDQNNNEKKISFKHTLNLPHTDFPIRSNPKEDDKKLLARWEKEDLYKKTFFCNKGNEKFILHDGPPYANASIHLGTALNKILKDITSKSQRMQGKQVPVTPGWDCHGLPIELKVAAENPDLKGAALQTACRKYAQKWIAIQKKEFKQLGVLMDWENPYLTMNPSYEADTLRAFAEFVEAGYITRQNKTVPWCSTCKTVLASAEIEHADRKDPSIYVQFPLINSVKSTLFSKYKEHDISVLVWTTTPWTLPLNRAVLLKPAATYALIKAHTQYVLVGKELVEAVCKKLSIEKHVLQEVKAEELLSAGGRVQHPFIKDYTVPLILDEYVALEEGTAAVHCAPGCGPQDYEVAIKNRLEIFSPITSDGLYDKEIKPEYLRGRSVKDGLGLVLTELKKANKLLHKESLVHSYPHCWRCRNGLIFRATKQWFCNLEKHDLKNKALKSTEKINAIPAKSINRLQATLQGRLEWCLSRQRTWGTPIPAVICNQCDTMHTSKELIEVVASRVAQEGIEVWQSIYISELLPKDFSCAQCESSDVRKESDILDVWFDSGISHYAVLKKPGELRFPADVYFEGKDQHRGWFQSSLLTSMVLEKAPSMKTISTHGYTVDSKSKKMSKSLGNVVRPEEIVAKVGTDGLRLWVASIDAGSDAPISDALLKNVQEVLRKVRNTARFLLSNLYDFDSNKNAIDFNELYHIDQYALVRINEFNEQVKNLYNNMDYTGVFHAYADFCTTELSSFYLDIVKDRLYVEAPNSVARRSAQTACYYILDVLNKLMAPILSFTAESIFDHYQKNETESIHLQQFATLNNIKDWIAQEESRDLYKKSMYQDAEKHGKQLKKLRSTILKAIEKLREKGEIKHSLEASIELIIDSSNKKSFLYNLQNIFSNSINQSLEQFLKEFLIVSKVALKVDLQASKDDEFAIVVSKATGVKCPRCWQWHNQSELTQSLCARCEKLV